MRLWMTQHQYEGALELFKERIRNESTPFWSPDYQGHMHYDLSQPHVDGFSAAMEYNSNNVAPEGSVLTSKLETEHVHAVARDLIGYDPESSWGYCCAGGTVGNLMALLIAREKSKIAPGGKRAASRTVLASRASHYSVKKACKILELNFQACEVDGNGRMILPLLSSTDQSDVLAVVCTVGTTETGVVDDVWEAVETYGKRGVWVHADAAYGGYYSFARKELSTAVVRSFDSMKSCNSVVVDAHKTGYALYTSSVFAIRDGSDKHVLTENAPYLGGGATVRGAWTLEGSRSGTLIASAYFGHEMLAPYYGDILCSTLRGARALKRELGKYPDMFTLHEPTDLGTVLFAVPPLDEMDGLAATVCDPTNTNRGRVTLAQTVLGEEGLRVFRVVILDPEFENYASSFVHKLSREVVEYKSKVKDKE